MSNFIIDENGVLMHYSGAERIVRIPDGVTEIGCLRVFPFQGNRYIEEVIFPESTTEISYRVFFGCTHLKKITFLGNKLRRIGFDAFKECTALESVALPDGLTDIGHAFSDCTGLRSVVLPKNMTHIGNYAFSGCSALESVTFPPNLQSVGENAFENCTSLKAVELPDTVQKLGRSCFEKCINLESVWLPEEMQEIGWGAFSGTMQLSELRIPNGITRFEHPIIGGAKIQSISIPASVTTLWPSIVYGCGNLKTITVRNSDNTGFADCVNVPKALRSQSSASEVSFTPAEFFEGCMKSDLAIEPWIVMLGLPINAAEAAYAALYQNGKMWHDRVEQGILTNEIMAEDVCKEMIPLIGQADAALKSPEYRRIFDFAAAHKTQISQELLFALAHALLKNNPRTASMLKWEDILGEAGKALVPEKAPKKVSAPSLLFTQSGEIVKRTKTVAPYLYGLKAAKPEEQRHARLSYGDWDWRGSEIKTEYDSYYGASTYVNAVFRGLDHQIRAAAAFIREHSEYYADNGPEITPTASPMVYEITISNTNYSGWDNTKYQETIVEQVMEAFPELKMTAFFVARLSSGFFVYSHAGFRYPTWAHLVGEVDYHLEDIWCEEQNPTEDFVTRYVDSRAGEKVVIRYKFPARKDWESFNYFICDGEKYYQIAEVNLPDSVTQIAAGAFPDSKFLQTVIAAPGTKVDPNAFEGSKKAVVVFRKTE